MRTAAVAVAMVVLAVAGCSSGSQPSPTATVRITPGPTSTAGATATPAPTRTVETLPPLSPTPSGEPFESNTSGPHATIELRDNEFDPSRFFMAKSQGFELMNAGSTLHNFTVPASFIDFDLDPGEQTTTEPVSNLLPVGEYEFHCKYHKGVGMTGTLKVVE